MEPATFQFIKLSGVGAAFFVSSLLQWLTPYRGSWPDTLKNWRTNLSLAVVGAIVMGLVCGGCVCALATKMEGVRFGLFHWMNIPLYLQIVLTLPILDLTAYAWHRANHQFPILWRFHSVHHSDCVFEASTAVRFHPGELLTSLGVRLLVVAVLGIPVVGILAFEITFAFFNFFEHGDTRLPARVETPMSAIFITPALHRKHHSMRLMELNTNFGTIFSFWDRTLRTFCTSHSSEKIEVGLPHAGRVSGLWHLLTFPLR